MSAYRYALYAVPAASHPLADAGARWLGRDTSTGGVLDRPAPPGLTAERFVALTAEAKRYGFHGTLKAPFRLAPGYDEPALHRAARLLVADPAPLWIRLRIDDDLGFPALRPVDGAEALASLADTCLRRLDAFRAPPTPTETKRRLAAPLTERQQVLLARWGYPYVQDQFRFHMTLGDRPDDDLERTAIRSAATVWFAASLAEPVPLVPALFAEPEPGAPFLKVAL